MSDLDKAWLPNLLMDGTFTDNTHFSVVNGTPTILYKNSKAYRDLYRRRGKQRKDWLKDEDAIWHFMYHAHQDLNKIFSDKKSIQQHVILFNNEEYEHNTPDKPFYLSRGWFGDWEMQIGNLIGFIRKQSHGKWYTLNISSRFGNQFLKALIADAEGFLEIENFGGTGEAENLEWLLLYLWKIKLKRAFRLGLPKTYVTRQSRLTQVRGNLNLLDYATKGKFEGKYLCNYREHSFNNDVNVLVNTTFRKVKSKYVNDISLWNDAMPMSRAFETAVKGKKLQLKDLAFIRPISNPYYYPYNEVIELSKKILRDELADFGQKNDFNALFFDVSMLFEYFIRKLLQRNGLTLNKKNKTDLYVPSGGNYKGGKRALQPDILYIDEDKKAHLFDVKYKRFDFKYGVKREDVFQIHTYLGQVTNQYDVVRCGFIYPLSGSDWMKVKWKEERGVIKEQFKFDNKTINFEIIFFKVPTDTAIDFKNRFKVNTDNFIKNILNN